MGSPKRIYHMLERLFALKMQVAGMLYALPVSFNLNLDYSFLKTSKDFIK
ncbi:MAG TPA: hypothetical protein VGD22_19995 [Sphingobacteriaceae bacterium]